MKNVQVIDGAINTAYNIYAIPDDEFELIFPDGQDIEFIEDFVERAGSRRADRILSAAWRRLVKKSEVQGIHGTLFYGLKAQKMGLYPNKRFADDRASER